MQYIFIISLSIILLNLFFLKKYNKKISLFLNSLLTLIIMMGYISTSCFILDKLNFELNLICSSIFNFIISIIIFYFILKKNQKQELYFDKFRLIIYLILLIIITFIMFYTFGFNLNISFYSPDAAAHFLSSKYFALSNELNAEIELINSQSYGDGFQFFFYTNLGTIFKCMPNINVSTQYNIFTIYNFFILYLLTISFFELLMINSKTKKSKLLAIITTFLYFFGYPLNTTLYGFSYWNTGILLCQMIIYMLISENINEKIYDYLLALLLFSLFCSYYLFVPVMYFCVFIYLIKNECKLNKINFKSFIIRFFVTLIIPFILGFTYFILYNVLNLANITNFISGIGTEGTIFIDVISNYMLLLPIALYAIIDKKNEKRDFINNIFLYNIIYVIILLALSVLNILSSYYFSKILYLNWILIWMLTYKGINKLNRKDPDFVKVYSIIYVLLLFLSIFGMSDKIVERKKEFKEVTIADKLFSIYNWNINYMRNPSIYFTKNDINLINTYINLNGTINKSNETTFIGSYIQKRWLEAITDKYPYINYEGDVRIYHLPTSYHLWLQNKTNKYLLIDKEASFVDTTLEEILKDTIIYKETEKLAIIKRKNK